MDETPYRLAYDGVGPQRSTTRRGALAGPRSRGLARSIAAAGARDELSRRTRRSRSGSCDSSRWSWTGVAVRLHSLRHRGRQLRQSSGLCTSATQHQRARDCSRCVTQRERESRPVTVDGSAERSSALADSSSMYDGQRGADSKALRRYFARAIVFLSIEVTAWMVALWRL